MFQLIKNKNSQERHDDIFFESSFAGQWINITHQIIETSWVNDNIRRVGKDYITPSEEMRTGLKLLMNGNSDENKIAKYYIISVKLKIL